MADGLAQDDADRLAFAAGDAVLLVLSQDGGGAVYINLQRVLFHNVQCAAKLGGKHDSAKLVDIFYDAG